jgi:hypothetical protein
VNGWYYEAILDSQEFDFFSFRPILSLLLMDGSGIPFFFLSFVLHSDLVCRS